MFRIKPEMTYNFRILLKEIDITKIEDSDFQEVVIPLDYLTTFAQLN